MLPSGWNQPWWKPALGIPLYVLGAVLFVAGVFEGVLVTAVQAVELLTLGLIAADAWGLRQRIPILNSGDKAMAAGGWVLLILAAMGLALLLPVL